MSRTSIIALLIFGASLGYFLSFGADRTRKFQAGIYQMLAAFFTTGSGLQKPITSVRTGLQSVAASVEGTREQGIVSGERVSGGLAPLLDLNFLTKQANLQPGQKAYTSGVGGVFPSGLFLGTVKSFKARALDGQAKLAPAVDLSHLEDVFVVTGRK